VEHEEGVNVPEDGARPTREERRSMTGEEGSNGVSVGTWRPFDGHDPGARQCEWNERRPIVDGNKIQSGSVVDSMYWVIARGAGETNLVRSEISSDKCGS
jgi:hypothetical protein